MTSSRSPETKESRYGAAYRGSLAFAAVEALQPTPSWLDERALVEQLRAMPLLQLLCGVVLVFGFIAIATHVPAPARPEGPSTGSSVAAFVTIIAALVTLACLD